MVMWSAAELIVPDRDGRAAKEIAPETGGKHDRLPSIPEIHAPEVWGKSAIPW